ncbi:MAG: hypothetical protein JRJ41_00995 [Deltaproteobacteria bacterium]|nr:hypothetical protein [Deltaproteobacteria bacterium]
MEKKELSKGSASPQKPKKPFFSKGELTMHYREEATVRGSWVLWLIPAILWFCFMALAWPHVGWFVRVFLIPFLLVAIIGVITSLKPNTTELIVGDGIISWGSPDVEIQDRALIGSTVDIKKLRRIILDVNECMTFFELQDEKLLNKLPWMFDGQRLCEHIKQEYPEVEIKVKEKNA